MKTKGQTHLIYLTFDQEFYSTRSQIKILPANLSDLINLNISDWYKWKKSIGLCQTRRWKKFHMIHCLENTKIWGQLYLQRPLAKEFSLQSTVSHPLGKDSLNEIFKFNLYLLKYTETSRCPVGVFSRFEARPSHYFFLAVRTCNVHWNVFERSFSIGRLAAICSRSCWFHGFFAFTRFLRHQMHSFFVRHVLNETRERKKIPR